ncbi:MAG: hypothetical protein ACHQ49_02155 [Elusimicrobiota bacterium]
MIAALPPAAIVAAAPAASPLNLESAFAAARAAARASADPASPLSGGASVAEKLAAIDSLQSRLPFEPRPARVAALDAIARAASGDGQPPEVRAKALSVLGYAMPLVDDDAARSRSLAVLLAAFKSPAYRIFALRGFGPACHGLPRTGEPAAQDALLDLLDGPVSGEERETALVALFAFVSTRADLAERAPALVESLDARLLAAIETDPARFVADPRFTPGARAMAIATIWSSARHREARGAAAPAARVRSALDRLAAVETDPTVLGWIRTYRDAAPARPSPDLRDSTTRRSPAGPDEP